MLSDPSLLGSVEVYNVGRGDRASKVSISVLEPKEILSIILHLEGETETEREGRDCLKPPKLREPGTDQKAKKRWTSPGPLLSLFTAPGVWGLA